MNRCLRFWNLICLNSTFHYICETLIGQLIDRFHCLTLALALAVILVRLLWIPTRKHHFLRDKFNRIVDWIHLFTDLSRHSINGCSQIIFILITEYIEPTVYANGILNYNSTLFTINENYSFIYRVRISKSLKILKNK